MKNFLYILLSLSVFSGQYSLYPMGKNKVVSVTRVSREGAATASASASPVEFLEASGPIDLPFLERLILHTPEGVRHTPVFTPDHDKSFLERELGSYRLGLFKRIKEDFKTTLTTFDAQMKGLFATYKRSIGPISIASSFIPFVQKKIVKPGTRIVSVGDLHGGLQTLINILKSLRDEGALDNNFKILNPNLYLVFLGDYVDRGPYGVEVIYTLMRLKIRNPEQVVLLRGNHEDVIQNTSRPDSPDIKFEDELKYKFDEKDDDKDKVDLNLIAQKFYNQLPLALYLGDGNQWVQFCHGGIDPLFNPQEFLKNEDQKKQFTFVFNAAPGQRLGFMAGLPQTVQNDIGLLLLNMKKQCACNEIINLSQKFLITIKQSVDDVGKTLVVYFTTFFQDESLNISAARELEERLTQLIDERETLVQQSEQSGSLTEFIACADSILQNAMTTRDIIYELIQKYDAVFKGQRPQDKTYKFPVEEIQTVFLQNAPMAFVVAANDLKQIKEKAKLIDKLTLLEPSSGNPIAIPLLVKVLGDDPLFSRFWQTTCLGDRAFAWGDFNTNPDAPALIFDFESCRWIYGKKFVQALMKQHGVAAIFRGHQHYAEMVDLLCGHDGVITLWNIDNKPKKYQLQPGMIFTLLLAPTSGSPFVVSELHDIVAELIVGDASLDTWHVHKKSVDSRWYRPVVVTPISDTSSSDPDAEVARVLGQHSADAASRGLVRSQAHTNLAALTLEEDEEEDDDDDAGAAGAGFVHLPSGIFDDGAGPA